MLNVQKFLHYQKKNKGWRRWKYSYVKLLKKIICVYIVLDIVLDIVDIVDIDIVSEWLRR
jgi:hypothetical protein